MANFTIDVRGDLSVLEALAQRLQAPGPFLTGYGEDMMERTKRRFSTATDPSGERWKGNAQVTVMNYLRRRGAFSAKTGKISAKGQTMAASKRPLQGVSGDLARQFFTAVAGDELTLGNSMVYAAMQHFGGKRTEFPHLWGDIPARRIMPITAAGGIDQAEQDHLINAFADYLGVSQ